MKSLKQMGMKELRTTRNLIPMQPFTSQIHPLLIHFKTGNVMSSAKSSEKIPSVASYIKHGPP
jgi:hypothetical protein